MTKQDILEAVALDIFSLEQILDEFFSQNVVIPKGENRHPYADVLHEWVEGAEIEFLSKHIENKWITMDYADETHSESKYRIKPQEPMHEWKWECFKEEGVSFISNVYMTEGEANLISIKLLKIEETKRVRK